MTKLSIIVPVYNVAPYLRKCVDSLLNQEYDDYEIILVDDGSTDNSGAICDEYASPSFINSLTRSVVIKVIHQKNGGLSAARNAGLQAAKGEYVCFVDSDDYWEQNVLSGLMEQVERDNLDVLRFNYQNVQGKGKVFVPFKSGKPYFDYSNDVLTGEDFLNYRLGYACYAVMFIIKRSLLINELVNERASELGDGNCLFTEGIYFEDTDWTPRMLLRAKRVSSTEKVVYNYLWREGSITLPDNPIKKKQVLEDKIKLLYGFKERQKEVKDKSWFVWQTAGTTMSILGILSTYPSAVRKPYLRQLKSLDIFPLSTYRASKNSRIKILIANVSPSLYCSLISVLNSITR